MKKIRSLELKSIPIWKKPNLCKKIEMGNKKSSPRRLQVQERERERETLSLSRCCIAERAREKERQWERERERERVEPWRTQLWGETEWEREITVKNSSWQWISDEEIGPQRDDAEDGRRGGKVRKAGSEKDIIFYWIARGKWGLNLVRDFDKN
jgi:hypothetical protein